MAEIAYHASHEQFSPAYLLKMAVLAERAGFRAIHSSDHFHPWSERQGHSGFSFAWLGAAMQATRLPFSMVCAPGQRYHPAIVAQAVATLAEMFPERFSVELGSGEALNENITGQEWPEKELRNKRLLESAEVIRALLKGDTVTHNGLVRVEGARLYTRPASMPLLMAAALTAETAAWAGSWADGLITVAQEPEEVLKIRDAFYHGGGAGKPFMIQLALSYAATEQEALEGAYEQWRNNLLPSPLLADLAFPAQFDAAGQYISKEKVQNKIPVSSSLQYHTDKIGAYLETGCSRLILHNVNRQQERFIEDFGSRVLPAL
ncbi:putative non-F420 flavinoid oxidoreductase [Filimonas zeae]|nr:TIGR03885 family FMN-dependent LLM class oxidoreductase [Filimonas zeae]MDR6339521.1 putative non-F420 flavinoid oxidoreductase [Filimonas zeae]